MCNRVLIANIRNLGICPCPRCLTPKNQIDDLGLNNDMQRQQMTARVDTAEWWSKIVAAHHLIYQQHYVVDMPQVETLLKEESLVPTKVLCFCAICTWYLLRCLECIFWEVEQIGLWFFCDASGGFLTWVWAWCLESNIYPSTSHFGQSSWGHPLWTGLLVSTHYLVDDEVSGGFWLRRYRQVLTFRRDTICQFVRNVSELKRTAVRDFEDILQVNTLVTVCSNGLHYYSYLIVCHPCLHWSPTPTP